MTTLTTLAWNAHGNSTAVAGRVVRGLDQLVRPEDQRITLTEVKGAHLALTAWADRNGWTLLQETPDRRRGGEAGDTAMLIRTQGRNRVTLVRDWVAVMLQVWWVIRYGIRHDPRRQQRAVLKVGIGKQKRRVRCSSEHGPTDAAKNEKARHEWCVSAARFLSRRGAAVLDGDCNTSLDDMEQLADDVAGKFRGIRPDWCITNGPRIDMTPIRTDLSDHDAYRYVVTL